MFTSSSISYRQDRGWFSYRLLNRVHTAYPLWMCSYLLWQNLHMRILGWRFLKAECPHYVLSPLSAPDSVEARVAASWVARGVWGVVHASGLKFPTLVLERSHEPYVAVFQVAESAVFTPQKMVIHGPPFSVQRIFVFCWLYHFCLRKLVAWGRGPLLRFTLIIEVSTFECLRSTLYKKVTEWNYSRI